MKDFCLNITGGDYYAQLKDLRRYILIKLLAGFFRLA